MTLIVADLVLFVQCKKALSPVNTGSSSACEETFPATLLTGKDLLYCIINLTYSYIIHNSRFFMAATKAA